MQIFDQFDLVVVPFPFTDKTSSKRRPAIIISKHLTFNSRIQKYILAMVTTSTSEIWPGDTPITNLKECGLDQPSFVRFKIFTLDHDIVIRKIGTLSSTNRIQLQKSLKKLVF